MLKQYLAACDAYGFRPWYLQSDRGSENAIGRGSPLELCFGRWRMCGMEWPGLPTGQAIEGFLQGSTEHEERQD